MKNGWLFPGQASQKVGMGKALFEKTEIGKKYYTIANDILDIDIQSISFNGPEELLNITKYTQPAIFIVSTIIGQIMIENGYSTNGVAGHSLGEYSALAVSGAYDFKPKNRWWFRPGPITINIGDAISPNLYSELGIDGLKNKVGEALKTLSGGTYEVK